MTGPDKPPFKLLSDEEFWKLSDNARLQYLKTAIEHARVINGRPPATPGKPAPKKRK